MAYIGNQPALQYITFAKQTFTADSSTVAFTLDNSVANENELEVFVNNVRQEPGSGKAYTASGTTLTMSEAPNTGDDFYCIYQGKATQTVTPGNGTVLNDHLASGAFSNITGVGTLSAATISGDLTVDTNTLKVDSTNNRVGIAQSSPTVSLHVGDSSSGSAGVVGKQIMASQDFSTTFDGSSAATWPGIQVVNSDDTSNRTGAGITFVHRSSGSGIAGIVSTSSAADRANICFITRGSGNTIAERMRIDDDGKVGIGISPAEKFHVVDTGSSQAAKIHSDTNNSGVLGMSILAGLDTPSSSGDCKWVRLADGNDSGKAYIQFKSSSPNAEFAAVSDERLKTNIQNTDVVGLDIINNLRLVKFDWNDTATQNAGWSMTGHQKLGFIAQEVEEIVPEFISEDSNGFKIMGDSGFVPYLVKAVQEQQTKIQELEARITALES
jgi:hypothetical protein